jgi:alkylation response protein AidB-like acyl-CoA dehydrogenase
MDFPPTQEQQAMEDTASHFEQELRDVRGLQIGDGTAQIMKMIIARKITGREA